MRVALAQRKHVLGDKEHNLSLIEETVGSVEADLVLFPEMFLTGYTLRDKYWEEAEEIPGESSKKISELAGENDCTIICGMPEKKTPGKGRVYNSALIAESDGELNVYRKSYLVNFGPFQDKRYFEADPELPLIDTGNCKLGVIICYDIFFPELTKSYAMEGADILVCISASPTVTRRFFEDVMVARAIENTCFFFYSNLLGREDQMMFWGGSTALSPRGTIIDKAPYLEEDVLTVDIDLSSLEDARRGRPALSDTRYEMMPSSDKDPSE